MDEELDERDGYLLHAEAYLGGPLAAVRADKLAEAFSNLSADEIVELSVANVNRS